MSDTCKAVSEVISIDDEDDDVEVVFDNVNKSHVYRNLICQKISQEIQLLQAMCTETVPSTYDLFKEKVKKFGFQFGDEVVQSAWQRIMKKYLMKSGLVPNTGTSSNVKSVKTPNITLSTQAITPLSSPNSSSSSLPSSALSAVPVALLLNRSVNVRSASTPRGECSITSISANDTDFIYLNNHTTHDNVGAEEHVLSTPQRRHSQKNNETVCKNDVGTGLKSLKKRKRKRKVRSLVVDKQSEVLGESQNSVGALFQTSCDRRVLEQIQSNEKKLTWLASQRRKSSMKLIPSTTDKAIITGLLAPESRCSIQNSDFPSCNNYPLINKTVTDNLDETSRQSEESYEAVTGYFDNEIGELNKAETDKKGTQNSSHKRRTLSKKLVSVGLLKADDQAIAKSHIGVKAKIVRTKQTKLPNSKKSENKHSKKVKEMSEEELKEFKAELKRLKYEEKREFEMQQLQKVHDRLVDVLIPKYYNKDSNL